MAIEPGPLLASGRAADVYDQGDGTVLRRYRIDHGSEDEFRIMRWLAEQGVPVPAVRHADGRDLVMERVVGPTMLEDLQRRPWMLLRHAATLARLQRDLAAVPAPDWLPTQAGVPPGDALVHLDLHPMNVLLGPHGPVIIDWTNASRGAAAFDAGYTYVLMATFEVSGLRDRVARQVLVRTFAAYRGRGLVRELLAEACERKLADPHTTPGERVATLRLAPG